MRVRHLCLRIQSFCAATSHPPQALFENAHTLGILSVRWLSHIWSSNSHRRMRTSTALVCGNKHQCGSNSSLCCSYPIVQIFPTHLIVFTPRRLILPVRLSIQSANVLSVSNLWLSNGYSPLYTPTSSNVKRPNCVPDTVRFTQSCLHITVYQFGAGVIKTNRSSPRSRRSLHTLPPLLPEHTSARNLMASESSLWFPCF